MMLCRQSGLHAVPTQLTVLPRLLSDSDSQLQAIVVVALLIVPSIRLFEPVHRTNIQIKQGAC